MTTIILIVVMLAAVVGMIVCNKKQETFAMAQPVAFVLLAVVIACGGYLIYDAFSDSDQAELIDRERRFSTSRGTVVAEYLKGKGINSVALLVEPKSAQSDFNVALVEAIKEAGIGTVEVIEIPAPVSEELVFFDAVKPENVQKAMEEGKANDAYIITPALPARILKLGYWTSRNKKPLVLFERPEFRQLDKMVENDMITGVIVLKSKIDYEADAPSDPDKAFAVRYIFVNKDNLDTNRSLIQD